MKAESLNAARGRKARRLLLPAALAAVTLPLSAEETTESSMELEPVRVTSGKDPLTSITPEKLMRLPGSGNDPLRAIEALPGVTFSNSRSSEPAVRGSSPDDNRYFIDFIPVRNIFHFDGTSLLNDNVIDGFSLEAAAFDAQYNDATGAIISATSRAPYSDRSQAILDFSFLKAGILLETPIDENQGVYLSVRQSLLHFYIENFLDDEEFEFTTVPEYYDYQGKYHIRLNDTDTLTFQAIGSRDKAGLIFNDDSDEVQQDPGLAGGINFESYFHTQGFVWDSYYSNGAQLTTGFSHMESDISFNIGAGNTLKATANDFNLRSSLSVPFESHTLRTGTEIIRRGIRFNGTLEAPPCDEFQPDCRLIDAAERITASDNPVIHNYDVFIADDWDISPTLTVTPGLTWSYDDYSEQSFLQPKFDTRWEFTEYWWLNAGWGRYHKFTDNFGEVARGFGNPDLKQSLSDHYIIGIEQQVSESLLWKVDTYYKTFDDLIIGREPKDPLYTNLTDEEYLALPRYTNDADGEAYGFEFFMNKALTEGWYGWVSVAWSETRRKNKLTGEDFRYSYDQPWIVNLVSSHELNEDWTVGFKWRYQSGQLVTPIEGTVPNPAAGTVDPVYGKVNSERLPAYHRLDVRFDRTYEFRKWTMDLYTEVLNIYNNQNVSDYEYNGDYTEKEEVTDLPLIISFGIKARI